jgi:methyl-accepting chemotaxis protein
MRVSVASKIGLGFASLVAVMTVSSLVVYQKVISIRVIEERITGLRYRSMFAEKDLGADLNLAQKRAIEAVLAVAAQAGEKPDKGQLEDAWQRVNKDLAILKEIAPRWNLQANRDRLASIQATADELRQAHESAIAAAEGGQPDSISTAAKLFSATATARNQSIRRALQEMVDSQQQLLADDRAELDREGTVLVRTIFIALLAALAIGTTIAVYVGRKVSGGTRAVLDRAQAIAWGDLTGSRVDIKSEDELGDIAAAIGQMETSLRSTLDSILASTERLASASEEISASAKEQASGADRQRNQTGQVATAMQEMSATVLEISGNSGKAAEAARKASDTARQGGKIVEDTLGKMRGIAQSVEETAKKVHGLGTRSDQIGQIIGMIDDIADHTNLLALNAAIEAARAGEQGRGFAVVADEVRKLAERTSKATKEIAAMIQSIQGETKSAVEAMEAGTKQVEAGVATTQEAGNSLGAIIESAEQVGEMVTHIATAATEQSAATEEANANLEQIAKITAETAEGAQQSAKACQDLSSLALDLQNLVSQFKLSSNGHRSAARSSRREPPRSNGGTPHFGATDRAVERRDEMEFAREDEGVLAH